MERRIDLPSSKTDLLLIFDHPNISIEGYNDIIDTLRSCPSLVNNDIISISHEIIKRMNEGEIEKNRINIITIQHLYSILKRIPDIKDICTNFSFYYRTFMNSPATSPVSPPPCPKVMKKVKKTNK